MNVDDLLSELDDLPTVSSKPDQIIKPSSSNNVRVNAPESSSSSNLCPTGNYKKNLSFNGSRNSFDDFLDEFDISPGHNSKTESMSHKRTLSYAGQTKQKCFSVIVSGGDGARGRNQPTSSPACSCNNLRCTKCDFQVLYFSNLAWNSAVDYLFFRNNYPTESKLFPQLRNERGSCAYCCQCSWLTAKSPQTIDYSAEQRWVCGGHT